RRVVRHVCFNNQKRRLILNRTACSRPCCSRLFSILKGHEKKAILGLMQKKRTKKAQPGFVVCVDNSDYLASLEMHKIYRVIPDEDAAQDGDIRVVDESGEDYLYSA